MVKQRKILLKGAVFCGALLLSGVLTPALAKDQLRLQTQDRLRDASCQTPVYSLPTQDQLRTRDQLQTKDQLRTRDQLQLKQQIHTPSGLGKRGK